MPVTTGATCRLPALLRLQKFPETVVGLFRLENDFQASLPACSAEMRPIATDVCVSVCLCVCLYVLVTRCDRDAVVDAGSCGSEEPCFRRGSRFPREVAILSEGDTYQLL